MPDTVTAPQLRSTGLSKWAAGEFERFRSRAVTRTGLLDTGSEDRFDRVTRAAARRFGTEFSILTLLVDDRMYLKSMVGSFDREVPRDAGFCNVTIQSEDGLVVPDTLDDPFFRSNQFVVGPLGLRFYAGVPLRGPAGWFVGALCVMDTQPRSFSDADLRALRRLGDRAELELNDTTRQVPQYVV